MTVGVKPTARQESWRCTASSRRSFVRPDLFDSSVMRSGLEDASEIVFVSLLQIAVRIDQEDGPQARQAAALEGCERGVQQDWKREGSAPGVIDDRFEFLIELLDRFQLSVEINATGTDPGWQPSLQFRSAPLSGVDPVIPP
jgi:hypothetical protein